MDLDQNQWQNFRTDAHHITGHATIHPTLLLQTHMILNSNTFYLCECDREFL
jgi:hypothetical protein